MTNNNMKSPALQALIAKSSKFPAGVSRILSLIGTLTEMTSELEGLLVQLNEEDMMSWVRIADETIQAYREEEEMKNAVDDDASSTQSSLF